MVEPVGRQATARGDVLRRTIAASRERGRRFRIIFAAASVAIPCVLTVVARAPPIVLWNASASTPRGLYRVFFGRKVRRGDIVIVALREPYRTLAARRGYLPLGVPLVKRVAAVPGDRICSGGATVNVDGKASLVRMARDTHGRALPVWSGCADLRAGEYLLIGESPWSFDGRYFGVTKASEIIGRATLLWHA